MTVNLDSVYESIVNLTGEAWSIARQRYIATPWYYPWRKFKRWCELRYFDEQFSFWQAVFQQHLFNKRKSR